LKDEFLATLSHELRTPLNAIMGWAHVLGQSPGDRPTVQRAAEVVRQNAAAQAQLIEDILDVSRIVGGKLHLDTAAVDLKSTIEAAIESLMPAVTGKSIQIERQLADDVCVAGDRDRLQQVVWNLLSNALKFTPKDGHVTVGLTEGEGDAEIFVSDNGIGIPADFLPYVFDRFRQADSSMSRRHSGLGLGMAIVRHLVELHGGSVSVESAGEGKGATFRLRLPTRRAEVAPLQRPQARDPEPVNGAVELERLQGLHVLIVEDDTDSRNVLALLLQKLGALVEAVASSTGAPTSSSATSACRKRMATR
jgi:signal transduction histidine kinase